MKGRPTVFVLDDDDAVRDALGVLLESNDIPVKTYESGESFLTDLSHDFTGCVVMDVRMPGLNGLEILERLSAMKTPLPVIIITGHGDLAMAVKAMKAGAIDFIEKPFDDTIFLESVRKGLSDGAKIFADVASAKAVGAALKRLTEREREVLQLVALGYPNKVIAYDLGISPRTVEIHRARVFEKLQARSLSHLVRLAITAGIIRADDANP